MAEALPVANYHIWTVLNFLVPDKVYNGMANVENTVYHTYKLGILYKAIATLTSVAPFTNMV